jgi:aminotransferase
MINLLNKNVKGTEMCGIRKIANKLDRSSNVINLTWGQPNFRTPEYVKHAGIIAIEENQNA